MHIVFVEYDNRFFTLSKGWLGDQQIKRLTMTPDTNDVSREQWFKNLKMRDDYYIQGIMVDNIPIGALGIKHIDMEKATGEYWGYIGEKGYIGKGIGHVMVSRMIDQARELGLKALYLHVADYNERAIGLYVKHGFKKIETIGNVILMHRSIS